MKFKKDESGKLDKAVTWVIKNKRPDLECLSFLCVWRDKEKLVDGKLVEAEVSKISNKNRDVFGYDVMLEVDLNNWKSLSVKQKKKLIFHELEHVQVEYMLEDSEKATDEDEEENEIDSKAMFEDMLDISRPYGEPKRDKQDRVVFYIVPHDIELMRFRSELLTFGLSKDEEVLRQFLNYVKKTKGLDEESND